MRLPEGLGSGLRVGPRGEKVLGGSMEKFMGRKGLEREVVDMLAFIGFWIQGFGNFGFRVWA